MIILNQKKDIIINFSNVVSIYVQEKNVQVLMSFIQDALILGKYATEARAKEVLEEIIKCYANTEQYKCLSSMPDCSSEEKTNVLNKLAENAVIYEMPES